LPLDLLWDFGVEHLQEMPWKEFELVDYIRAQETERD